MGTVINFPIVKEKDELTGYTHFRDTRKKLFRITYLPAFRSRSRRYGVVEAFNREDAMRKWIKEYPRKYLVIEIRNLDKQ